MTFQFQGFNILKFSGQGDSKLSENKSKIWSETKQSFAGCEIDKAMTVKK